MNEDRILDRTDASIWAVADGMGGHANGSLAAETVIAHLARLETRSEPVDVSRTIECANTAILRQAGGTSGTTIVVLRISNDKAQIWWAGDSRAYLIRNRRLNLLTRDHSLVQELVDVGEIAAHKAAHHPRANIITRALGVRDQVELEKRQLGIFPGDILLLCSDGLSRSLAANDMQHDESIEARADRLLENALKRDGRDNISLVLVEAYPSAFC
ncbi:SpoIIE family protein phosphatase [Altererythrobacter aurantiacus]|uniref:SpoIIE family protein phosphatase n=1 Tax=Parapontixanthobacter aurantiacus TaxID=1463599 RepID=A0A844ZFH2_9SPHN|nr:SpoIIE family protein phosphatase [Parapontixanthobacter aurantiacus]